MSEDENKLLPQAPVLSEYDVVKTELEAKIKKLNSITELTEENKKEVKTGIAEINKVKERISRYRIDETNRFLEYIQPYVDKCKELEKLCDTGLADIKQKVKDLENAEKALKKETYQSQIKSEAEIAAIMASDVAAASETFEKKIDIVVTIKQLPKSKGAALEQFLNSLGVEFTVEVIK